MATHTIPTGSLSIQFKAVPAPDLMDIIERTVPGKDGMSILYSLLGGLEMRISSLAAMVTNVMAAQVREGDGADHPAIDKYNDAMSLLDEREIREWAFNAAGLTQKSMIDDLRALLGFRLTVADKLSHVSGKPYASRWQESISRAATPMAVEEWKLELSWTEYQEACKGKVEMTEEEFRKVEAANLAGPTKNWNEYIAQIVDTISYLEGDSIEFDDMPVELQKRLLESISSPEKEARFRTSALKLARNPSDLHTRRAFISSFCCAAREALTHSRYADKGEVIGLKEQKQALEQRRLSESQMMDHNKDTIEDMVSDTL